MMNYHVIFFSVVAILLHPIYCKGQSDPCQTSGRFNFLVTLHSVTSYLQHNLISYLSVCVCVLWIRCGEFGVCDSRGSPVCTCPRGFQPRDAGNESSGCTRRAALDCEGGKADGFLTLQILTLSSQSDLWLGSQADCELRCLTNCSCLAYGFYGLAGCRFYTHPLIDLVKFSSGSNVNIRVSKSVLGNVQKLVDYWTNFIYPVYFLIVFLNFREQTGLQEDHSNNRCCCWICCHMHLHIFLLEMDEQGKR